MNYTRLKLNLEQYGRNTNYAYVSDSFKPYLRQDSKYRQWKRLVDRVSVKAMTQRERAVLGFMLDVTFVLKKYINSSSF